MILKHFWSTDQLKIKIIKGNNLTISFIWQPTKSGVGSNFPGSRLHRSLGFGLGQGSGLWKLGFLGLYRVGPALRPESFPALSRWKLFGNCRWERLQRFQFQNCFELIAVTLFLTTSHHCLSCCCCCCCCCCCWQEVITSNYRRMSSTGCFELSEKTRKRSEQTCSRW